MRSFTFLWQIFFWEEMDISLNCPDSYGFLWWLFCLAFGACETQGLDVGGGLLVFPNLVFPTSIWLPVFSCFSVKLKFKIFGFPCFHLRENTERVWVEVEPGSAFKPLHHSIVSVTAHLHTLWTSALWLLSLPAASDVGTRLCFVIGVGITLCLLFSRQHLKTAPYTFSSCLYSSVFHLGRDWTHDLTCCSSISHGDGSL